MHGATRLARPDRAGAGTAVRRAARREPDAAGLSRAAHRHPRSRHPPRRRSLAWSGPSRSSVWPGPARAPTIIAAPRSSTCRARAACTSVDAIAGALERAAAHRAASHRLRDDVLLARRDASSVRPAGGGDSPARGSVGRRRGAGDSRHLGRRARAAARARRPPRRSAGAARRVPGRRRGVRRARRADRALRSLLGRVPDPADAQRGRPLRFRRAPTTSGPIAGRSIAELLELGYEDAYRQFIEPVVGASGDELERREAARPLTPPPPPGPTTPSIAEMLANLE